METLDWSKRNGDFAGALLDPDTLIPNGIGRGEEEAPKRFSVYRNNVVVSLMEALEDIFPSIKALLGDENFARITRAYVAKSPPRSALIQAYGDNFAEFVDSLPPLRELPFLRDVAKVERSWLDAYHSADAPFITPDDLSGFTPEQTLELTFQPHPSSALIESEHPVFDLFNARETWPNETIDFQTGQDVLITRIDYSPQVIMLAPEQSLFLRLLLQGANLANAIGESMEKFPQFAPATAIALALDARVFTTITIDNDNGEHAA